MVVWSMKTLASWEKTCPEKAWIWRGEKTSKCCLLKDVLFLCSPQRDDPDPASCNEGLSGLLLLWLPWVPTCRLILPDCHFRLQICWSCWVWDITRDLIWMLLECCLFLFYFTCGSEKPGKNSKDLSLLCQGACWHVIMSCHSMLVVDMHAHSFAVCLTLQP